MREMSHPRNGRGSNPLHIEVLTNRIKGGSIMAMAAALKPANELARKNGIRFPNENDEYRRARDALLAEEIELRRHMERVAGQRRALPPGGIVPKDYVFEGIGPDGRAAKMKLSDLFGPGKETLIVYSFMFPRHSHDSRPGPTQGATARLKREDGPCPSCTAFLDSLDGAAKHVEAAGHNFVIVAEAPLERLIAFAKDRQWSSLRLLSSAGNSFKHDYHARTSEGSQMPMMTVFRRSADGIRHFWSSEMFYAESDPGQDPRHNGTVDQLWNILDLTPEGRPSGWDVQLQCG
jgi:predicted dithiol-disulfide oxidoreductase (DUF899 family)